MEWNSTTGGHSLEYYLPPCVCGHPVEVHKSYPTGKPRRKCQTGTPLECECREYNAGDPANWPPIPPQLATLTESDFDI